MSVVSHFISSVAVTASFVCCLRLVHDSRLSIVRLAMLYTERFNLHISKLTLTKYGAQNERSSINKKNKKIPHLQRNVIIFLSIKYIKCVCVCVCALLPGSIQNTRLLMALVSLSCGIHGCACARASVYVSCDL